ncbi:MAG: cytochrome P450 [Chloroflexi bacterium]|nr:cytochrome P450 [Chloroflexota bacterium]
MGSLRSVTLVDLSQRRSFAAGFPHEYFTWLRRHAPVFWHEPTEHTPGGEGFWVVSRYDDVLTVFKNPATFSSEQGGTQLLDNRRVSNGITLNQADDPRHHRLRSLVSAGFTPRTIARLEDDLRRQARQILADVPIGESFDFVTGVARELPLQAICNILGVPQEDRTELADWVDQGVAAATPEVISRESVKRLGDYGDRLIAQKRREPADDILSLIVHARIDDATPQLNDRELRAFFNLLFLGGVETTRNTIAGGLLALIEHPDELARLRHEPALLRTGIEEMLRWTSPSVHKRRTATADVELGGQRIGRGQKVTIWEMSANRDERVFAEPFRFDVGRQPNPHVAFGYGPHFCLGASLARLELRIMFEELLTHFDRFELAGEPSWAPNNRLLGLMELPVRMTPWAG